MKNLFVLCFVSAFLGFCSIDRTALILTSSEINILEDFKGLDSAHTTQIANENEEGQKLWLCLTFVSKEDKKPLVNQEIKLYQTSAMGEYEPSNPRDESTARLSGSALTNDQGRIFVQTILPGDYGNSVNNRHIHTTVACAHPVAYDIHFKQYTSVLGTGFVARSDQHFLADLKQTKDNILVTFLTVEVKKVQVDN